MSDIPRKAFLFPKVGTVDEILSAAEQEKEGGRTWDQQLGEWEIAARTTLSASRELFGTINRLKNDIQDLSAHCTVNDFSYSFPRAEESSFALALSRPLPSPLQRGQFFEIQVHLVPNSDSILQQDEKVPIAAALKTLHAEGEELEQVLVGQCRAYLRYDPAKRTHSSSFRIAVRKASTSFPDSVLQVQISASSPLWKLSISPLAVPVVVLGRQHFLARRKKTTARFVRSRFSDDDA